MRGQPVERGCVKKPLAFLPLLRRRIEIKRLLLVEPSFVIETDASGTTLADRSARHFEALLAEGVLKPVRSSQRNRPDM